MKIKKKFFLGVFLLLLFFLYLLTLAQASEHQASPPPVSINSPSAILVEEKSGKILWEKNSRQKRPIASTTKILTALLVLERVNPNAQVVVNSTATRVGGAKVGIKAGERRSVRDLLFALMLQSANDAAVALAEYVGGSEENFVRMMNEKAKKLGANDSLFSSPHGLSSGTNHYSTSYDLAILSKEALKSPLFREIVKTREYYISWPVPPSPRLLVNKNEFLKSYPAAAGIKTGYTAEAGYCLVASAKKKTLSLILVVLGSKSREESYLEAQKLFNYGFNHFAHRKLVLKGEQYFELEIDKKKIPLVARDDFSGLIYNHPETITYTPKLNSNSASLPVKRGSVMGKLIVSQFGKRLGEIELIAAKGAFSSNFFDSFRYYLKRFENLF